jgi:hypothetical protein
MPRNKNARPVSEKLRKWGAPKSNNTSEAKGAKIEIRRNVLAMIGADRASVLDCFAGAGEMWRAVWREAHAYVGCDKVFYEDERTCFACDTNRLVRNIDLSAFNIVDADHYGSPWEPLYIISRRRTLAPGERFGVVITEGQGMKMQMGGLSISLAAMASVSTAMPGMGEAQDFVIDRALMRMADVMGAKIEKRWDAHGRSSNAMRYIGVVMRRPEV